MEQHHRELIQKHLLQLAFFTNNLETVLGILLETNIINNWMKNHILSPPDNKGKNENFYDLIQGRGPKAFVALCKALEETSNIRAHDILVRSNSNSLRYNNVNSAQIKELFSNLNLNNPKYDVKVHPKGQRMDVIDDNLPTGAYPMGSKPKGHVLILNMSKVRGHDDRLGSDVDVNNLQQLFHDLGFIVQSNLDLNKKEFEDIIREFIKTCRNEKTNSIVVFIMSHGEAGEDSSRSSDILTAEGNTINTDWIIEQFGSEKIFQYKPKLFFIQGCRGKNSDLGWDSINNRYNRLQNDSTSINGSNSISNSSNDNNSNRRYENVFIAHATIPGYNAKRDPIKGSWFVQKLCKVISENAWNYDLNTMMKLVDLEISKLNSEGHGFQTVEWTYRGFNKKFYFNPGLYDNSSDHDVSNTT